MMSCFETRRLMLAITSRVAGHWPVASRVKFCFDGPILHRTIVLGDGKESAGAPRRSDAPSMKLRSVATRRGEA
jgi:hypothetical protein